MLLHPRSGVLRLYRFTCRERIPELGSHEQIDNVELCERCTALLVLGGRGRYSRGYQQQELPLTFIFSGTPRPLA